MSKFQILNDVLNKDIIITIKNNKTTIKENDKNATLKEVTLRDIFSPSYHITPNAAQTNCLLAKGRGQLARCDALILMENRVFFIELKSTNNENKYHQKCIEKFLGVECLINYVDSVIEKFYESKKLFSDLEKWYILFYQKRPFNKTSIRNQPANKNTSPANMLKIAINNGDEISINRLFDNVQLS